MSRAPFIYFTDSMKQKVWQECHEKAFTYFGSTPKTILYDNLKSTIIQRIKTRFMTVANLLLQLESAKHQI